MQQQKVSLILGSGGARGISQIGAIQWLLEQGVEIDEVVGCSIGSLVGAAFAGGKIGELGEWMSKLTKREVFRLMDFSDPRFGILKGQKVMRTLQEVFEDVAIETLGIKFTAVATDLANEQEVVFRKGSIYSAIRASIAIPAVFQGVQLANKFLVDGGVLNPVPINYVQNTDNIKIAINLDGPPKAAVEKSYSKLNALDLLQESYMAMRRRLSLLSIQLYQPDYVINIPNDLSGIWDFDRSSDLIKDGYELTRSTLSQHIDKIKGKQV
ncbi:patatin-like phospholipase family protein [Sphingobacterium faecale]|uniref:Patatin-like phospholipase family protein n=1 Tax=Sphingobacterium faecale TaxID=2803775 RepID=A0ABS1R3K0_9SPHI|nr:patatin-like phospholipase family protein [Sphingobacterium faecale]MBL1409124.1 patatin-like phospholipase family protein [Sphingobacterium faecale]